MPAAGFDFNLDDKAIGDVMNYIDGLNGTRGAASTTARTPLATTTTTATEGGEKSHER